MFFLNGELIRREPALIEDHGQYIPDYENMTSHKLGMFNIQPVTGHEDLVRALHADTEWVAIGGYDPGLESADRINILFTSGRYISDLEITAPVLYWDFFPAMSHIIIQLKKRDPNKKPATTPAGEDR